VHSECRPNPRNFAISAFDNVNATLYYLKILQRQVWKHYVVSPECRRGSQPRAFAKLLDRRLSIIEPRRPRANDSSKIMHLMVSRWKNMRLVDLTFDTGGRTLCAAAKALKDHGAEKVIRLLHSSSVVRQSIENIQTFRAWWVGRDCITIPLNTRGAYALKIRANWSIVWQLCEAVRRYMQNESLQCMFGTKPNTIAATGRSPAQTLINLENNNCHYYNP